MHTGDTWTHGGRKNRLCLELAALFRTTVARSPPFDYYNFAFGVVVSLASGANPRSVQFAVAMNGKLRLPAAGPHTGDYLRHFATVAASSCNATVQ